MKDKRNVFVKIETLDGIESKKGLLEATASLIEALIASRRFKEIKKEESRLSSEIRKQINTINFLLNRIEQELPQIEELPKIKARKVKVKVEEKKEERKEKKEKKKIVEKKIEKEEKKKPKLEQELEEIKAKLSKL